MTIPNICGVDRGSEHDNTSSNDWRAGHREFEGAVVVYCGNSFCSGGDTEGYDAYVLTRMVEGLLVTEMPEYSAASEMPRTSIWNSD